MEAIKADAKERLNIAGQRIAEGQSRLTRNPKTNKVYETQPKLKHRQAMQIYKETGNLREAIDKAGFSPKTRTRDIIRSKSWEQLLEQRLSDDKLTLKHLNLLESKNENIAIKALDLGYKVKNKYQNEQNSQIINVQVNNLYERALKDI